jgi:hypothetical protein
MEVQTVKRTTTGNAKGGRSLLGVSVLREGPRLRRARRFVAFDVRRLCDPALIVVRQLQQPPFDERVGVFRESPHGSCSFPAERVVHAVAPRLEHHGIECRLLMRSSVWARSQRSSENRTWSAMTFLESSSRSIFLFEHDLRANAWRLSRGKPGIHFALTRPSGSGSCSRNGHARAPLRYVGAAASGLPLPEAMDVRDRTGWRMTTRCFGAWNIGRPTPRN